jgi:hypothetical protein
MRWQLVKEFGWTLEQVDSLSVADLHEYLNVRSGQDYVKKSLLMR